LPKTGNWDIGAIQYNATKPTKALQPKRRHPRQRPHTLRGRVTH